MEVIADSSFMFVRVNYTNLFGQRVVHEIHNPVFFSTISDKSRLVYQYDIRVNDSFVCRGTMVISTTHRNPVVFDFINRLNLV